MQIIKVTDRKIIELNDVLKVNSFNSNEFSILTPYGNLKISGKNLTINKMDTSKKELEIIGQFDSLLYINNKNEKKKENIFAKIFK